jgi:hypothetical protein
MNVFAMNLATGRVDDRYLQVLIVAQAVVAKVLCKLFAMINRVGVGLEIDSDPVSERDAIFHIEKEFLHFPRLELLQWKSSTRLRGLAAARFWLPAPTIWFNQMHRVSFHRGTGATGRDAKVPSAEWARSQFSPPRSVGCETASQIAITLTARSLNSMRVEPFSVLEQGAKRRGDLPMLIAFGAGRKRTRIAQNIAPVIKKFRLTVTRLI